MGNQFKCRTLVIYKNYFPEFFAKQNQKVKDKIIWTFSLIEEIKQVPETYLKHIEGTNGLYEIRVQQGNDMFRIFCFFEEDRLLIIGNSFQKKTQKTPRNEVYLALKIKEEYHEQKR